MSLSAGMAEGASVVGALSNQLVHTPQAQRNQHEQILTSNSVDQILMVEAQTLITTYHPTVQVLNVRRIAGKSVSWAIVLSDGRHWTTCYVFRDTPMEELICSGRIEINSIIQLKEYFIKVANNNKHPVLKSAAFIGPGPGLRLGTPTNIRNLGTVDTDDSPSNISFTSFQSTPDHSSNNDINDLRKTLLLDESPPANGNTFPRDGEYNTPATDDQAESPPFADLISHASASNTAVPANFGSPRKKSPVTTDFIPSPLKDRLQRVPNRYHDKWYKKFYDGKDPNGGSCVMIEYKTDGEYIAKLDRSTAKKLISGSVSPDGTLYNVKWHPSKKERSRSSILRKVLRPYQPDPLDIRFSDAKVSSKVSVASLDRTGAKRQYKKRSTIPHDYSAFINCTCSAATHHGCTTQVIIGFTEPTLINLFSNKSSLYTSSLPDSTIPCGIMVIGDCIHIKGLAYGQLRGDERIDAINDLIDNKKLANTMPKKIMEESAKSLSSSRKHCMNHGGTAVSVHTANNLRKKARQTQRVKYGLMSPCLLTNVYTAGRLLQLKDVEMRRNAGDNSTDFRGILRDLSVGAGDDDSTYKESLAFKAELWNKTHVVLYHFMASSGRLTVNYDGTGSIVKVGIDLSNGELIMQHVLSINGNAFANGQTNGQLIKRKVNTKGLAHFFTNRSAFTDHTQFLKRFVDAEKTIFHGKSFAPYVFSSDCAGENENACLEVWPPSNGRPVNKIAYCNVLLYAIMNAELNGTTKEICKANVLIVQEFNPVIMSTCKSHVQRAAKRWSRSTKRGKSHRAYHNQFTRMVMHPFYHATDEWDICESIVQFGLLMYIVSEKTLPCGSYTSSSRTQTCSDRNELQRVGRGIRAFIESQKMEMVTLTCGANMLNQLIESQKNMNDGSQFFCSKEARAEYWESS